MRFVCKKCGRSFMNKRGCFTHISKAHQEVWNKHINDFIVERVG